MAIEVETKDCTAVSDAELAEMADLCAESPNAFEVGLLSKQCEEWVLVTVASEGGKIRGFSFCTGPCNERAIASRTWRPDLADSSAGGRSAPR